MCISNSLAFRILLRIKRVYHQYSLGHILLLASYFAFIFGAAVAFFLVESFQSEQYRRTWHERIAKDRQRFVTTELLPDIFNNTRLLLYIHNQKSQYLTTLMNNRLSIYEETLKLRPPMPPMPTSLVNSLLFVVSAITTVGYGYVYPVTDAGRVLAIFISIIGIPFTILVIKDLSYLLAILLTVPCQLLAKVWATFRFCTLKPVNEEEFITKLHPSRSTYRDYRLNETDQLITIPITVAVLALFGWVSLGCLLMHSHLPNGTMTSAFYFIFNSLTTTGVGDIELPHKPLLLILFLIYLLIGLTFVSLFINLINTKFTQAYWLPGRFYTPLRTNTYMTGNLASFDSFEEMVVQDCPFNHYTTLGVLHTEDKRALLGITKATNALVEATTQTETMLNIHYPTIQVVESYSPELVILPNPHSSHDDVNDLIGETYDPKAATTIGRRFEL